jgi:hypothetical protein
LKNAVKAKNRTHRSTAGGTTEGWLACCPRPDFILRGTGAKKLQKNQLAAASSLFSVCSS